MDLHVEINRIIIFLADETASKICLWIDRGMPITAGWTDKSQVTFTVFEIQIQDIFD